MDVRLYIERLRHGHTYEQMAHHHNLSRQAIGQKIKHGRNLLLRNFVPNHLGFEKQNRDWLKSHTTDLARILYCGGDADKCVL